MPRASVAEIAGETLETLKLACQRFCAVALLVHHFNTYGRTLEASMLNAHTRLAQAGRSRAKVE